MLVCFSSSLEGLRNHVQVIASSLSGLDSLLGRSLVVSATGVGTRTTPCSLTGSEDTVDHVDPVEERVDDEHEGVQHDLVTAELGTKVEHEKPVETQRNGNETNGKVGNLLRGSDQRDTQDEEEQRSRSDGVLHEADDEENWVALPETNVSQHANFVGDKTQEPAAALLKQRLVGLYSFGFAESSSVHLNLVSFFGTNHEQVSEPAVLAQMALAVVEEIVALLGLVSEVVLGHSAESRKSKHSESTGQASDGTTAGLD